MKKNIFIIVALVTVVFAGCDFLDHEPDMRASINSKEKVQLLLVSAYTNANSFTVCEFSSDNIVDNTVPDPKTGYSNPVTAFSEMYNEIFAWKPVVSASSGSQDSPNHVWDGNYFAIATANQALEAIEKLEAQGINMDAEKGEALLSRAYHHFLLAGVFCQAWKNEEDSKKDMGITYMYKPETRVAPEYSRGPELVVNTDEEGDTVWVGGSLYHTFMAIEKDLEAGLKLVSDEYYTVPRYHFNVKAAHAFATRFYLFKRDWANVVKHADYVLGTLDDATLAMLYDAQGGSGLSQSDSSIPFNFYINPQAACNLLLYTTYSLFSRAISSNRYGFRGDAGDYTASGSGPCWRGQFPGVELWTGNRELGYIIPKAMEGFEFTDKVAGIGYPRGVTRAFTTNEVLLNRAEAKIHLNQLDAAVNDLRLWAQSYNVKSSSGRSSMDTVAGSDKVNLTQEKIKSFYAPNANVNFVPVLHNQDMSADWVITPEQLPLVHCALHFRRIETIHEGHRWHDIKRYGIEITHVQGKDAPRVLVWNDDRRAIQLPQEVIMSGLTPNPRVVMGDNLDGSMSLSSGTQPSDVYWPSTPQAVSANSSLGALRVVTNND